MLSAVLLGLSRIAGQEPLVSVNHVMAAQAQALAEGGIERALWALSNPESPEGTPWDSPASAPYDGSRYVAVTTEPFPIGGFRVAIVGNGDRERRLVSVGLVPGDEGLPGRARREVSATAIRLRFPGPLASLTVRGELTVGPGVTIDASGDGSCGTPAGTWSRGVTTVGAGTQIQGRSADPATPGAGADILQNQSAAAFDRQAFSAEELSGLKAVARAMGTYYQGAVAFDAARRLPDGLVFVDTAQGHPISDATPTADLAAVTVGDGAAGSGGRFRGWIVVRGSLAISGAITIEGLIYVADRLSQTGAARLVGAAMAGHVRSLEPSLVDARPAAGSAVTLGCEVGRTGGGLVPQRWLVKPGTYRESAG